VAFQKCRFKEVQKMIELGGNPHQKNNNGESIHYWLELTNIETVIQLVEENGSDIFFKKFRMKDGKEFICKINIFEERLHGPGNKGKVVIQDHDGNAQLIKKLKDPFLIVLALCLTKEAGESIEQHLMFQTNEEIIQSRTFLQDLSKFILREENLKMLKKLEKFYSNQQAKVKEEQGLQWCCTNILHKAAEAKNWEKFKFCHTYLRANLEAKNEEGKTALEALFRASSAKENPEIFWFALKNGASSFAKTDVEKTEVLDAVNVKCFQGTEELPSHLEHIFIYAASQPDLTTVEHFLKKGFKVDCCDDKRRTALHSAVKCGNAETTKVLLKKGADPNARDIYKMTPVHYAVSNNHLECLKALASSKGDVNVKNQQDQTPLHLAAKVGSPGIVNFLLKKDANVNATDKFHQTALHIATENKNYEILKALEKKGAKNKGKNKKLPQVSAPM
jgi:ankyrin repeat protein